MQNNKALFSKYFQQDTGKKKSSFNLKYAGVKAQIEELVKKLDRIDLQICCAKDRDKEWALMNIKARYVKELRSLLEEKRDLDIELKTKPWLSIES